MSSSPLRYADGEAIRARREARHMTQAELADAVGDISQNQISQIENGRRDPSIRILSRICDILGVERGPFLRSEVDVLTAAHAAATGPAVAPVRAVA